MPRAPPQKRKRLCFETAQRWDCTTVSNHNVPERTLPRRSATNRLAGQTISVRSSLALPHSAFNTFGVANCVLTAFAIHPVRCTVIHRQRTQQRRHFSKGWSHRNGTPPFGCPKNGLRSGHASTDDLTEVNPCSTEVEQCPLPK